MKVQPGASRAAILDPPDLADQLRCFLVLHATGQRCFPAVHEKLARLYAKAQGGVLITMVPEFPRQADEKVRAAFAPTAPVPLE